MCVNSAGGQHLSFPMTRSDTNNAQLILQHRLQSFSCSLPEKKFRFHFRLLFFLLSLFLLYSECLCLPQQMVLATKMQCTMQLLICNGKSTILEYCWILLAFKLWPQICESKNSNKQHQIKQLSILVKQHKLLAVVITVSYLTVKYC